MSHQTVPSDQLDAPVAIVGMACRLPGGVSSPDELWAALAADFDALCDVPADRWAAAAFYDPDRRAGKGAVLRGGFLTEDVRGFDAGFFGISPREAEHMDPQQRLLLEVAWEAVEDAGLRLEDLAGTDVGVYVGGFTADYSQLMFAGGDEGRRRLESHTSTGVVMTMLSNRISHALDLCGPSMTVDTACSSSLVAVHLACEAIRRGECGAALVGGVNVMLSPSFTIAASQGGFLSPTSTSAPFDADADGYVRGEGAGIVLLKPLEAALRDGDRVHAVLRGTAVTQDGRTNGITVPNAVSQQQAMRRALSRSGVTPAECSFVEAHGTGTPVGDPIEARAIGDVYGTAPGRANPVLMSSVKGNIGHLEAAAGVVGLIKAALCLEHRSVPAQHGLRSVNPQIDVQGWGLDVPMSVRELPARADAPLVGAVNSFGFGGTNAHVVLTEHRAPVLPARADVPAPAAGGLPVVIPVSARGEASLRHLAADYAGMLEAGATVPGLAHALVRRRTTHDGPRLAVVAQDASAAARTLRAVAAGESGLDALLGDPAAGRLAHVFTGMGPQWWGMARGLLTANRVFREAVEECDALLRPLAGWSLVDELRREESGSRIGSTDIGQPANFAVQVGLSRLWDALGAGPDAVVGHSAGEPAAAYAAGALTLADAVTVIYHRARLQHRLRGRGRLAAVGMSEEEVAGLPWLLDGQLGIAAVNDPGSVALVGPETALHELAESLSSAGVFIRLVPGDVPYHSAVMDLVRDELLEALAGLAPRVPTLPLYSTVTGERVTTAVHDADYWWGNVRQPVRFGAAMSRLVADGARTVVEVGPAPTLRRSVATVAESQGAACLVLPSLVPGQDDGRTIARTVARLFTAGHRPALDLLAVSGPDVRLPHYPWDRENYWAEAEQSRRARLGEQDHPLLGRREPSAPRPTWRRAIDRTFPDFLDDHRVRGAAVFPGAAYVELALAAARLVYGVPRCSVRDVTFDRALVVDPDADVELVTSLEPANGRVEVHSRLAEADAWTLVATARVEPGRTSPAVGATPADELGDIRDHDTTYAAMADLGFEYGPAFRSLRSTRVGEDAVVADLLPDDRRERDAGEYVLDPALLDACFQALLPLAGRWDDDGAPLLPTGLDEVTVHTATAEPVRVHARVTARDRDRIVGDAVLLAADGTPLVTVRGFRVDRVGVHVAPRHGTQWLHEVAWEPLELQEAAPAPEATFLVLGPEHGHAGRLVAALRCRGARSELVEVPPGASAREAIGAWLTTDVAAVVDLRAPLVASSVVVDGDVPATARRLAHDLLDLVRALLDGGLEWPLRVVTSGAQAVAGDVGRTGLVQAPLWGLARTLHQESLPLDASLVDLDPGSGDLDALADELLHRSGEDQVAFRDGQRLVARLHPTPPLAAVPVPVRPDATYVVTGGLGSLGLLFARWWAERGARHVVLTSRTGLPTPAEQDALAPDDPRHQVIDAVRAVRALGAEVEVMPLDVTDVAAVRSLVLDRARAGRPVRGVIHSAGAVRDRLLTQMSHEDLDHVLAPKIDGSWALHEALHDQDVDVFALFSSVSSVVVTTGQGNYAAGNAFMDALSHHRHGRGEAAVSLNWGPWDVGMIADLGLREAFDRRGIDLVEPAIGTAVAEQVLGSSSAQQVVVSADWATLVASYPIVPRLIEHLAGAPGAAGAEAGESLLDTVLRTDPADRPDLVVAACADLVATVLRMPPDKVPLTRPLNQVGLDSMTAVELRIRIEKVFSVAPPVVDLVQGASVASLAATVCEELAAATDTEALGLLAADLDDETLAALLAEVEADGGVTGE